MRVSPSCWIDLAGTHDIPFVEYAISVGHYLGFEWQQGRPILKVRPDTVLDAILISIAIDHARGAKFRSCNAPDCGMAFLIESRKTQKVLQPRMLSSICRTQEQNSREEASRVLPEAAPRQ